MILRQMGGSHRLGAMIGAHSFVYVDAGDALIFRWKARAKNKANSVKMTLEPSDTYRVEFWSIRGTTIKQVGDFDGIYADQLKPLFETQTGLYLSL